MIWSVIRKATPEDFERLEIAARRFCRRNAIDVPDDESAVEELEEYIACLCSPIEQESDNRKGKRLRKNWLGCIRRALGENKAEGIACGNVLRRRNDVY